MLVEEIVKKFGEDKVGPEGRFTLSTLSNGDVDLTVDYDLALKTRLGVSYENFCLYAFEGRLRMSPEFLGDLEAYHQTSLDDCLRWVLDLETSGNIAEAGCIDFRFRPTKGNACVLQNGQTLAERQLVKEEG